MNFTNLVDAAGTAVMPGLMMAAIGAVLGSRPAHPWHAVVYATGLGMAWAVMEYGSAETERALAREVEALQRTNERLRARAYAPS